MININDVSGNGDVFFCALLFIRTQCMTFLMATFFGRFFSLRLAPGGRRLENGEYECKERMDR